MLNRQRLVLSVLLIVAVGGMVGPSPAFAQRYYEQARVLKFTPEEGAYERQMLIFTMRGVVARPFRDPTLYEAGNYWLRMVYKDEVTSTGFRLNDHSVEVYAFQVANQGATKGFGPELAGEREGGRGTAGGGGGGPSLQGSSFPGAGPILQPNPYGGPQFPMQAGPGGGGGGGGDDEAAGTVEAIVSLDDVLIQRFGYTQDSDGFILDVTGLEPVKAFSKASLDRMAQREGSFDPAQIRIDFDTIWSWFHMLVLPDHPLQTESIWFATIPMRVPGLPDPILVDAEYRLLTYHRFGNRKVAVIDMQALGNFDVGWTEENDQAVIDFKAVGTQSINARYFFDFEKGTIFGVERPPLISDELLAKFSGQLGSAVLPGCLAVNPGEPYDDDIPIPVGAFGCAPPTGGADLESFPDLAAMEVAGMRFPGLVGTLEMRYYTRTKYKTRGAGQRILREELYQTTGGEEIIDRRWVNFQFFGQLESE